MSTGFATLASAGSSCRRARAGLVAELGELEPGGIAGVGAEDAQAAGVREHATRRPRGSGWVESSAAASTSSSSVSARMTPAWWKSASTAASEPASAAVWEPAARAPAPDVPALHGQDRLACARPGARCARTCAGCRTTRGRAGRAASRRRPPSTRAGRWTRRRPCCRSRRTPRSPRLALGGLLEQREAERAALRRERRSSPGGSARGPNVAFRRGRGDGDAEAVGADRFARRARERARAAAPGARALAPISANPAEITQSARTPAASASRLRRARARREDR